MKDVPMIAPDHLRPRGGDRQGRVLLTAGRGGAGPGGGRGDGGEEGGGGGHGARRRLS